MLFSWIFLWSSNIRWLVLQPFVQELSMRILLSAITSVSVLALTSPAFAQTATATGVGIANSRSSSQSAATAIGGGAGGSSTSSVTLNAAATPAVQTINNTGTQTIRNVPTEFAPGLAAAGLETCLGSVSGGGAFVGTGFSFGTTIPDPGCATRLDARTLWAFGLKKAAVARLCLNNDIYNSMPEVCVRYLPYRPGYAVPVVAPVAAPYADPRLNAFNKNSGEIMLVDGKTGVEHLCLNYDAPGQRCRVWANAVTHSSPKKLASRGNVTAPAAQPSAKQTVPLLTTPTSVAEETEGKPK
jgi:hypothetical protein